MRRFLVVIFVACAPAPSQPPSPPSMSTASTTPSPPLIVAGAFVPDAACDRATIPSPRGMIVIPDALFAPAAANVVHAICGCTRSGQSTHLSAFFVPDEGKVTAHAGTPEIDACLQNATIAKYPPFTVGSDCIDCGPKHFGIFHDPQPPPTPTSSTFTYAFVFLHP